MSENKTVDHVVWNGSNQKEVFGFAGDVLKECFYDGEVRCIAGINRVPCARPGDHIVKHPSGLISVLGEKAFNESFGVSFIDPITENKENHDSGLSVDLSDGKSLENLSQGSVNGEENHEPQKGDSPTPKKKSKKDASGKV